MKIPFHMVKDSKKTLKIKYSIKMKKSWEKEGEIRAACAKKTLHFSSENECNVGDLLIEDYGLATHSKFSGIFHQDR